MAASYENLREQSAGFATARLKLANGWGGRAALYDSAGNSFTAGDWAECLSEPGTLSEEPEHILKADGGTTIVVRNLKIADGNLAFVVKCQRVGCGFKNFCRSLLPSRAALNFHTAMRLCRSNIPVARPLAALRQRKGLFATQSIYLAEYIQGSANLHAFLRDNHRLLNSPGLALRRNLCFQIAHIFASLHNASLWHRDAKAGNFLVYQHTNGQYKITLVDMDGIKPYGFRPRSLRFRCLAKLAATLMWHRSINMTDYLRTFTIYSNLVGLDSSQRRRIFRDLARRAVAIRLLTLANAAMESPKQKKSTAKTKCK